MFTRNYLIAVSLFFSCITAYSQTSITEGYPLEVGNVFVFRRTVSSLSGGTQTYYYRGKVLSDSVMNSRRYFYINYYSGYNGLWWRLDTIDGRLFTFDSSNACSLYDHEKLIDSLWVRLNDSTKECGSAGYVCVDTSNVTIFNLNTNSKEFYKYQYILNGNYSIRRKYARGFGLISYQFFIHAGGNTGSETYILRGCVIDSVYYGDTTIPIGINEISSELPASYELSFNYPNPFNSETKIKFRHPSRALIQIAIFDINGKLINTLVDGELFAGEYEVEFDGSELSSGVYFYRLEVLDDKSKQLFSDTKRMVLLK